MATQQKAFFRGDVPTTSSAVYSVPSGASAVITSMTIVNETANPLSLSISIGSVSFLSAVEIAANDTIFIDTKQVLNEFDSIDMAGSLVGLVAHVNGVEIS